MRLFEVNTRDYFDGDDRSGDPVDDEANGGHHPSDDGQAPIGDRGTDVDRRNQNETNRIYGGRIEPPECERRRRLDSAPDRSPDDRWTGQGSHRSEE